MNLNRLIEKANTLPRFGEPFQHPRPNEFSIRRINEHFEMALPETLLEFVRSWRDSGRWFASLGDDYESPEHIIRINSYWRRRRVTRRLPHNFVVFNLCHDEDCDCFNLDAHDRASGEYEIRYWYPGFEEVVSYPTLLHYMDLQVSGWQKPKAIIRRNDHPG
jgi:hypothetical protein